MLVVVGPEDGVEDVWCEEEAAVAEDDEVEASVGADAEGGEGDGDGGGTEDKPSMRRNWRGCFSAKNTKCCRPGETR